jgi:hypothetical protein
MLVNGIRRISFLMSGRIIILITALVIFYHFLILFSIVPYELTWGGKLKSYNQMIVFETISIVINCLIILVVFIKLGFIKRLQSSKLIKFVLWFFVLLFALNTIGNLFAENVLEKLIFTPITLVLSLLFCRLVIEKNRG